MRRILLTMALFSSIAHANSAHLINELELTINRELTPQAKSLIHTTLPQTQDAEPDLVEDIFIDLPIYPSAERVCVERCEGQGDKKVCWSVCVD